MGLVSRKGGVRHYCIYNLHHQATGHSLTLLPTSRWPGGFFDITGDNYFVQAVLLGCQHSTNSGTFC